MRMRTWNGRRVRELMKATLILANGSVFSGTSIGGTSDRICEMVFNTSMTGYQEILTDPSYAGQGVVMSYPLIGNYGVNHEDNESRRPWVEALVVRHLSPQGSNFRCEDTLDSYLKQYDITGIQGVDKGQVEAARSLGMTQKQAMRMVILPQAFKLVIPPLGNEFVMLLKDTSLLAAIGLTEIMKRGQIYTSVHIQPFPTYIAVALVYLVLTLTFTRIINWYERRLQTEKR